MEEKGKSGPDKERTGMLWLAKIKNKIIKKEREITKNTIERKNNLISLLISLTTLRKVVFLFVYY